MNIIDYIQWALRDIVGGAAGGLVAVWLVNGLNRIAFYTLTLVLVLGFAVSYYAFEIMNDYFSNEPDDMEDVIPPDMQPNYHSGSKAS